MKSLSWIIIVAKVKFIRNSCIRFRMDFNFDCNAFHSCLNHVRKLFIPFDCYAVEWTKKSQTNDKSDWVSCVCERMYKDFGSNRTPHLSTVNCCIVVFVAWGSGAISDSQQSIWQTWEKNKPKSFVKMAE